MGSLLSPIIADIYMEFFENMAIERSAHNPTLWCHYMDNTFVVWPHGRSSVDSFLQHLNSLRPTIQFTMETETDGILDVLVHRKEQDLTTTVYRKPTHTDFYQIQGQDWYYTVSHAQGSDGQSPRSSPNRTRSLTGSICLE